MHRVSLSILSTTFHISTRDIKFWFELQLNEAPRPWIQGVGVHVCAMEWWTWRISYIIIYFRYDPKTDTWTLVAPISSPRDAVGVCLLGDKIYAVGGYDGQQYLNDVECYDPQSNEWSKVSHISKFKVTTLKIILSRVILCLPEHVLLLTASGNYVQTSLFPCTSIAWKNTGWTVVHFPPHSFLSSALLTLSLPWNVAKKLLIKSVFS